MKNARHFTWGKIRADWRMYYLEVLFYAHSISYYVPSPSVKSAITWARAGCLVVIVDTNIIFHYNILINR